MVQSISGQLAEFIGACGMKKIPPEVVERARVFVMDYLGVALTASSARSSQIIGDVVAELGGRESCVHDVAKFMEKGFHFSMREECGLSL